MTRKRIDQELALHSPTMLRLPRSTLSQCTTRRSLRLLKKPTEAKESGNDQGNDPANSATHFCGEK